MQCHGLLLLIFGGLHLSSSLPFDHRTGESRGFAFVRYKYADEAQKAVDRLDSMMPLSLFGLFVHHVCLLGLM